MRGDLRENKQTNNGAPRLREFQRSQSSTDRTPRPFPSMQTRASGLALAPWQASPPSTAAGNGAEPPPGSSPFPRWKPLCSPGAFTDRISLAPLSPRDFGSGDWAKRRERASKGGRGESGPTRVDEPHFAPGKHRPNTAVQGPVKDSSGKTASGETLVRPVYTEDGGQKLSFAGALVHLELSAPPALTRSPGVLARTDGSLTIAVEEL